MTDLALDIPATVRQRYDPASPMRLPAFWTGAITARDEADVAARKRLMAIRDAVTCGTPVAEVHEFREWLAHDGGRSLAGERPAR